MVFKQLPYDANLYADKYFFLKIQNGYNEKSFRDLLLIEAEAHSRKAKYNLCIGDILTYGLDSKWRWGNSKFFDVCDSNCNYKETIAIPYWYWMKYYPNRCKNIPIRFRFDPNKNYDPILNEQYRRYFQNTSPLNKIEDIQNFNDLERIYKEYACRAFKVSRIRNYNFTNVIGRTQNIKCIDFEIMSKSPITYPLSVIYSCYAESVEKICNEFELYHEGKHDLIYLIAVDKFFNEIQYFNIESLTSKIDYKKALDFINKYQNIAGLYVPKGYGNSFWFTANRCEGKRPQAYNFLKGSLFLLIFSIINENINSSLSLRSSISNCKIYNCLFPDTFDSFRKLNE